MNETLARLFQEWAGEPCLEQHALGANGSNRKYFRLNGATRQCMATENDDVRENETFLYYSAYFKEKQLPVPEIFAVSEDHRCYLQQDLGDTTLYGYLYDKKRLGGGFDAEALALYKQALSDLVRFQTACQDLDFTRAYPRSDFDRQSMQWDLNYFKYYFLKLAYIPFDEQLLEQDFNTLMDYLLDENCGYFMYRDFQSRNIMIEPKEHKLYYIDYQGGRRGAAQYDVASLLYSAKSDLPESVRQELLGHYLNCFSKTTGANSESMRQKFYGYVLIRIMQAMGAYGYRGYYERKEYFLKSIPLAVNNLRIILENHPLPIAIPHLTKVWNSILETRFSCVESFKPTISSESDNPLTVTVLSFSYKKGVPADPSGNGGGFVFDCRALPNPGRYPEYRSYTGKDKVVQEFLQKEQAVDAFLENVFSLVSQSVKKYTERRFSSLMVCFGCTGGQHRSVYCAEQTALYLKKHFDCHIVVKHIEQD